MKHRRLLTDEEIQRVVNAAMEADLCAPTVRRMLLFGIPVNVIGRLDSYARPADQTLSDVTSLTLLDVDGSLLGSWLDNAAYLSPSRTAAFFRRVAQLVRARANAPDTELAAGLIDDDGLLPSASVDATSGRTPVWRRSPFLFTRAFGTVTATQQSEPPMGVDTSTPSDPTGAERLPPDASVERPLAAEPLPSAPLPEPASDRPLLNRAEVESRLARGDRHFDALTFDRLDLTKLDFTGARFTRVSARGADFTDAILDGTTADDMDCLGARFVHARFRATGAKTSRHPANWSGASFKDADLQQAIMPGADLTGADLTGVNLLGADLTDATLDRATLRGARVEAADLTRASLRGIRPDHRTTFADARVDGCVIDKASLEALGDDYGGLQRCHRMVMRIIDPVADLRASFSGFWAWFHAIALLAFVAPYLLFVARITLLERARDHADTDAARAALTELRAWAARQLDADRLITALDALQRHLTPDGEAISVARALGRFIYTGGALDGHVSWLALLTFTLLLAYNAARGYLLWRTKSLEHQEDISGLPARFTPDGMTRALLAFARFGAWGNLLLVLGHTIAFLVNTQVWL